MTSEGKRFILAIKAKEPGAGAFGDYLSAHLLEFTRSSGKTRLQQGTEINPAKKKAPETAFRKPFSILSKLRIPFPRIIVKTSRERLTPFRRADFFCQMRAKDMEPHTSTTPFGRRSLTLAHVASQAVAKTRPPEKVVHKWNIFRAICTAKARIGVSERALAVLDALLSFHPETALTGDGLIVFPSNQQLSLRAHGMAPATLRRHLAALVDAGLIVRRDSPNGKRYARKDREGEVEIAFGFDLSPLVVRSEEFEAWAEEVRAEARALKLVRERITLCRRDIAKMIATGIEEGVPTRRAGQGLADWSEVHTLYRGIVERIPRTAMRDELEPVAEELSMLADEVLTLLETHIKSENLSGNEFSN